jgi:hypothetical protein
LGEAGHVLGHEPGLSAIDADFGWPVDLVGALWPESNPGPLGVGYLEAQPWHPDHEAGGDEVTEPKGDLLQVLSVSTDARMRSV